MKLLLSALTTSALALALSPAQAAMHHHMHVAYYHHHHRHYGAGYGYVEPYPYAPAPYPNYAGYVPGYFYATPGVDNPDGRYGPYRYSWGYRNTLNLLLNNEGDPPFSE